MRNKQHNKSQLNLSADMKGSTYDHSQRSGSMRYREIKIETNQPDIPFITILKLEKQFQNQLVHYFYSLSRFIVTQKQKKLQQAFQAIAKKTHIFQAKQTKLHRVAKITNNLEAHWKSLAFVRIAACRNKYLLKLTAAKMVVSSCNGIILRNKIKTLNLLKRNFFIKKAEIQESTVQKPKKEQSLTLERFSPDLLGVCQQLSNYKTLNNFETMISKTNFKRIMALQLKRFEQFRKKNKRNNSQNHLVLVVMDNQLIAISEQKQYYEKQIQAIEHNRTIDSEENSLREARSKTLSDYEAMISDFIRCDSQLKKINISENKNQLMQTIQSQLNRMKKSIGKKSQNIVKIYESRFYLEELIIKVGSQQQQQQQQEFNYQAQLGSFLKACDNSGKLDKYRQKAIKEHAQRQQFEVIGRIIRVVVVLHQKIQKAQEEKQKSAEEWKEKLNQVIKEKEETQQVTTQTIQWVEIDEVIMKYIRSVLDQNQKNQNISLKNIFKGRKQSKRVQQLNQLVVKLVKALKDSKGGLQRLALSLESIHQVIWSFLSLYQGVDEAENSKKWTQIKKTIDKQGSEVMKELDKIIVERRKIKKTQEQSLNKDQQMNQKAIKSLQTQLQNKDKEINTLKKQATNHKNIVKELNDRIKELSGSESIIEQLQKTINTNEIILADKDKEVQQAQLREKNLKKKNDEMNKQIKELKQTINKLNTDMKNSTDRNNNIKQLTQEINQMQNRIKEKADQLKKSEQQRKKKDKELNQNKRENNKIQQQKKTLQQKIQQLQAEITKLKKNNTDIKKNDNVQKYKGEIENLNRQIEDHKKKVSELEAKLQGMDEKYKKIIQSLQNNVEARNKEIEQHILKMTQLKKDLQTSEREKQNAVREKNTAVKERSKSLEENHKAQQFQLKQQNQQLQINLNVVNKEINTLKKEIQALKRQNNRLKQDKEKDKAQIVALKGDQDSLKKNKSQIDEQWGNVKNKFQELQDEKERLQKTLKNNQAGVTKMKKELQTKTRQISQLKGNNYKYQVENQQLRKELAQKVDIIGKLEQQHTEKQQVIDRILNDQRITIISLNEQIHQLTNNNNNEELNRIISAKNQELQYLTNQNQQLLRAIKVQQKEIQIVKQMLQTQQHLNHQHMHQSKSQIEELRKQIQNLDSFIEAQKQKSAAQLRQSKDKDAQIVRLRQEIDYLKTQMQRMKKLELSNNRDKEFALQKEKQQLEKQIDSNKNYIDILKEQVINKNKQFAHKREQWSKIIEELSFKFSQLQKQSEISFKEYAQKQQAYQRHITMLEQRLITVEGEQNDGVKFIDKLREILSKPRTAVLTERSIDDIIEEIMRLVNMNNELGLHIKSLQMENTTLVSMNENNIDYILELIYNILMRYGSLGVQAIDDEAKYLWNKLTRIKQDNHAENFFIVLEQFSTGYLDDTIGKYMQDLRRKAIQLQKIRDILNGCIEKHLQEQKQLQARFKVEATARKTEVMSPETNKQTAAKHHAYNTNTP